MDHIVYLDASAGELEKLLSGDKTMIVRGAAGRKLPYGRVQPGDQLYFMENNGDGIVKACAVVSNVLNSEKLTEEQSRSLLTANHAKVGLTPEQTERWAGKRYLVLIEVKDIRSIEKFSIDRSGYGNMDDWLPVGVIDSVRK